MKKHDALHKTRSFTIMLGAPGFDRDLDVTKYDSCITVMGVKAPVRIRKSRYRAALEYIIFSGQHDELGAFLPTMMNDFLDHLEA